MYYLILRITNLPVPPSYNYQVAPLVRFIEAYKQYMSTLLLKLIAQLESVVLSVNINIGKF